MLINVNIILLIDLPRDYSQVPPLSNWALGEDVLVSLLGRFALAERVPGTHCVGGWLNNGNDLDAMDKRKIPFS
jgi:hypothetical protein